MSTPVQLIMPMAGRGSRFTKEGFSVPKPLIKICGKPFFYWSTRSIEKYIDCAGITFVVLEEHVRDFSIDREIADYFPSARVKVLSDVTEGAAITCLRGVEGLSNCDPVVFNDCDHLFCCSEFNRFCTELQKTAPIRNTGERSEKQETISSSVRNCGVTTGVDGALLTFESDSPAYSYLEFDNNGSVLRTIEKQVVSHDAICGAYYFRSRAVFESACADYLMDCEYKEYYLSGVYNSLIASGGIVKGFRTDFHLPFGIPEEYAIAEKPENRFMFEELS